MEHKVTIVMTIRENYSLTIQTIDSLIQYTTAPYRFIFVNYKVPDNILQEVLQKGNIEIFNSDSPYPSVSMKSVISEIKTPYTVFLDNNISFSQNWLENLIICMEINKAGVVGPAYLWNTNLIHMFGGNITITDNNFTESHFHMNQSANILKTLKTRKCDFVEFHCLMIRTDLLQQGALDDSMLIIHQHIDLSFMVKKMGYDTFVTPHSVMTYANQVIIQNYEIDLFKERWNINIAEKDIEYFCKKWNFKDGPGFEGVRNFLKNHNSKTKFR